MKRQALGSERGFTAVELLISMAIMIGVTAVIFSLADPARGTYRTQPEVSDLQQRLRVGASFLVNDIIMAGAGSPAGGALTGSLLNYFAPIQPFRTGMINPDPPQTFRDDVITVFYVPVGSPQTTIETAMPTPSSELKVYPEPSCTGSSEPLGCKFKEGMRVIIFDESGAWDDMTITEVQDSSSHLQHNKSLAGNTLTKAYKEDAQIAQVMQRTFYWNQQTLQLMNYDGDQRDEAIVDNVVNVKFEYFGDPRRPLVITNPDGSTLTTYGPKPPAVGISNNAAGGWPAGENCLFTRDAGLPVPRPEMPDLAAGSQGLVSLTETMLEDGPWCPDTTFPTRFDADLFRIRKIGVTLRVQVASSELRGPAGVLFSHGGSSSIGRTVVPDQEIRFEITPRNFNLGR